MEDAKRKERERYEMAIFDQLESKVEMELPDVLVEAELDKMLSELRSQVAQQGMELEKYFESIKSTEEKMREQWKEQAEKRVRSGLILRKVGEAEKIEVKPEEIELEVMHATAGHAGQGGADDEKIQEMYQSPQYKSYVEEQLRNRKTLAFLAGFEGIEGAKVSEAKKDGAESKPEASEKDAK